MYFFLLKSSDVERGEVEPQELRATLERLQGRRVGPAVVVENEAVPDVAIYKNWADTESVDGLSAVCLAVSGILNFLRALLTIVILTSLPSNFLEFCEEQQGEEHLCAERKVELSVIKARLHHSFDGHRARATSIFPLDFLQHFNCYCQFRRFYFHNNSFKAVPQAISLRVLIFWRNI